MASQYIIINNRHRLLYPLRHSCIHKPVQNSRIGLRGGRIATPNSFPVLSHQAQRPLPPHLHSIQKPHSGESLPARLRRGRGRTHLRRGSDGNDMRDATERLQEEEVGDAEDHRRERLGVRDGVEPRKVGVVDGEVRPEIDGDGEGGDQGDESRYSVGAESGSRGDNEKRIADEHELPEEPEVEEEAAEGGEERGVGEERRGEVGFERGGGDGEIHGGSGGGVGPRGDVRGDEIEGGSVAEVEAEGAEDAEEGAEDGGEGGVGEDDDGALLAATWQAVVLALAVEDIAVDESGGGGEAEGEDGVVDGGAGRVRVVVVHGVGEGGEGDEELVVGGEGVGRVAFLDQLPLLEVEADDAEP